MIIKVLIQIELLNCLPTLIDEYNLSNKPKLKLDVAVYFLSLFNSVPTQYRIVEKGEYIIEEDDYLDEDELHIVSLNSQKMKKIHADYNKYFDFFLKEELIILSKDYSTESKESRKYRITDNYLTKKLRRYTIKDKTFLKNFINGLTREQIQKNEECFKLRPYLLRSFDVSLKIEHSKAFDECETFFETDYRKYSNGIRLILEIYYKLWSFSIKTKSDNRLHTNFTRTPKYLRKYITYKNENIIGMDIKTSQPYFLCVIIKAILLKDKKLLEAIGATQVLNGITIDELFKLDVNKDELIKFVLSVLDVDYYTTIQEEITIKQNEEGKYYRTVQRKNQKGVFVTKILDYDTSRKYTKILLMEFFYSGTDSKIPEVVELKSKIPSIAKIFKCLEDNSIKKSFLLQYIEAYCLLDVVAKRISEKYPEIPIWSIHDCLVTTKSNADKLKELMVTYLAETTTLTPQIELETWTSES